MEYPPVSPDPNLRVYHLSPVTHDPNRTYEHITFATAYPSKSRTACKEAALLHGVTHKIVEASLDAAYDFFADHYSRSAASFERGIDNYIGELKDARSSPFGYEQSYVHYGSGERTY